MEPSSHQTRATPAVPVTLMIADDDPVTRSMLSIALDRRFDIVAVAEDAQQAVESAGQAKPHAALVDVQMPGGGGLAAVRGITASSPNTAVIVLSSDESDDSVRELVAAGAVCYVRKGIDAHELAVIVEQAIRAHSDGSHTG